MPSTDIDGTPILILGAEDVQVLRDMICDAGGSTRERRKAIVSRVDRFLNDPQVIEWRNK